MRRTKLPLWYISGILIYMLVGVVNYLGLMRAIVNHDIELALVFQYVDFLVIGSWLVINCIMIFYLISINGYKTDYIPPAYFISLTIIYVIIIARSARGEIISPEITTNLSVITSGMELMLAGAYMIPFFRTMREDIEKTKINKRKT